MKVFFDNSNLSNLFLGKQKIEESKTYRLNAFCIIEKIEDNYIAYNNLTKVAVEFSYDEYEIIKSLPCKYEEKLDALIENWFLVPSDFNELKVADQLYSTSLLYDNSNDINNFIILTTTDCNARCFYCYEHGVKRNYMSEETAEKVAQYIIKNHNNKPISIKWFGGEPLYNSKVIDIICKILSENNVEFTSRMTTNGYLFDDEIIQKALHDWNLKRVQITLDGTEKVYNQIKAYIHKDCESPFIRVLNNIKNLLRVGINVNVRLNVSDKNRDNMYELIDYLSHEIPSESKLSIYSSNLFDLDRTRTDSEMIRLNNEYFKLDNYLVEKNYRKYDLEKWSNYTRGCMAQNKHSVVISPLGLLGKCEHFSEGERMFGSIFSDDINLQSIEYWNEHNRVDECSTCPAYPNCNGMSHCPDAGSVCYLTDKPIKINSMKQGLINEYFKYKNKL